MKWFKSIREPENPASGVKEKTMKATLDYIDDVMVKAMETSVSNEPTKKDRDEAHVKAMKLIGGFRVKDEQREKKLLDEAIERRRKVIKDFSDDRLSCQNICRENGIIPMAI